MGRVLKHDGRGDEACSQHCPACRHEQEQIDRRLRLERELKRGLVSREGG